MREFQLMRYLRRWWWLIAVLAAVSGTLFYTYISSRQTYRAQTMIEFANAKAEEGLYPSGDKIDIQEIRSSSVIAAALNSIDYNGSVDSVRERISISEYLDDQQQAIKTAKMTAGQTYDPFPTRYIITYTSASSETATDTRRMVEAIVNSYVDLYSEKYLSISKVPNSAESLQNLNYDYIEWAEILDSFIKDDLDYLSKMSSQKSRSSTTGYTFKDLYNEYNLIYTIYLPALYADILDHRVTRNRDLLVSRYQYRINQNDLEIRNYEEALSVVENIIGTYTKKNHDTIDYHWRKSDESNSTEVLGNSYVVNSVYDFEKQRDNYQPQEITYDNVMDRYVDLRAHISAKNLDNDYCRYILSFFQDTDWTMTQQDIAIVDERIEYIESRLRTLDALLTATAAEHSSVETVRNVKVRSTVNVREVTNVRLYTIMIVAVFFVFGVVGIIIIGRTMDFVEYRFYTDPSTDLPNRLSCDMQIEKHSQKLLDFPFTCMCIQLTNMNEINAAVGRDAGNETLRIFAGYIHDCADNYGFVGYNGGLQFLCLFEACDEARSTFYQNLLMRTVGEFNRGGHGVVIRYKVAAITATEQTPMSMRELLSSTMQHLRLVPVVTAEGSEEGASGKT